MIRWLVLALALTSCVDQPTQVFVRLATDIPDIDTVVIRIYDDDEALVREQVLPPDRLSAVPADGRFHPIGTFGLVPQDNDPNRRFRVVIDVTVRREETVRFETRARSGFVRDNTIRLDIFIAELCIDLAEMCEEEGLTCGIDGCVPEDVPPESLPPIDDDPIPDDPIDPRRFDGGFVADSGVDAPTEDVPGDTPDLDAMDSATDTLRFDGGPDGGLDAAFDGGGDDGGFDGGMLMPGVDDAPILFPWSGFRFEGTVPRIAFRGVPGIDHYEVVYRDLGEVSTNNLAVSTSTDPIVVMDLPGIPVDPGGRRIELQVLSCDGPTFLDCSTPLSQFRYVDLERVRCDFNNDLESDVVVGQSNGSVHVWMSGRTSAPVVPTTPHGLTVPTVSACADLDGDGDSELVSMQALAQPVGITDWNGSSLVARMSPFMARATSIVAADFDSDGFEDVVFADVAMGQVFYARGQAGPSLQAATPIARISALAAFVASPNGRFGRDLAVTDVNTDGYPDLIIADANDRDDAVKTDSGLQISYGGSPPFVEADATFVRAETAGTENFGWRVAGLGVSDSGDGAFVVAAPEGGTGRVYEYRAGANSMTRTLVPSPDAGRGFCCFPNDLAGAVPDFGTANLRYWVGYGDYENTGGVGTHQGRTYDCTTGTCVPRDPPSAVNDSYFGFDIAAGFSGDRAVTMGRAGGLNGLYVFESGAWRPFTGGPSIGAQSVLVR